MASHDNDTLKHKIIGIKQANRGYLCRYAIRIVALNELNQIALVYAKEGNYFKLPGGGIDQGEDHQTAAAREVQEETGTIVSLDRTDREIAINIPTSNCMATTEELRNDLHRISYCCYFAKVIETTGKSSLVEDEIADELNRERVTIKKALESMSAVEPASEVGRYIQEQDTYLLTEAKKLLWYRRYPRTNIYLPI